MKSQKLEKIPKVVRLWEVDGYTKLSDKARAKFKRLIRNYGVRNLARHLKFDREALYSIYGGKKFIHSIPHLIRIAKTLDYDLEELESEVTAYGGKQANMYKSQFPFLLTPLHLRAVTIHGDGSYYYNEDQNHISVEWYQSGNRIEYMAQLLDKVIKDNPIKSKVKCKKDNIHSISIPNHLVRLVCASLNLELKDFYSIEFFKKVVQLPLLYRIQVLFQFIVDEGHLKGTTLTVSQRKKWSREGFKILIDSLNLDHSDPINDKDDITIYNYNFPKISYLLKESIIKFGNIAGLWFKEKKFVEACERINPHHYPLIRESTKINQQILNKLRITKSRLSYSDIKKFGRTSRQANKAIRCWKKNDVIQRVGWNKYKILEKYVKDVT